MKNWKFIPGYEGFYMVSSCGYVKSVTRLSNHSKGGNSVIRGRTLKQENMKGGYKRVTLSKDNKQKRFHVHRLVAMCFIPNKENKPCVNHIDGNPSNNNVNNLEWVTYSENERHSYDVLGKTNANRMLTDEQVEYIKKNAIIGKVGRHTKSGNLSEIANQLGVSRSIVYNVVKGIYYV